MWFDPVAFYILSFPVRWYGIAWATSFLFMLYVPSHLALQSKPIKSHWQDIVCNALLAAVIGGRLGEMLIFQHEVLLADPLSLIKIWQGGMSFHGALLCGGLSFIYMARYYSINFWVLSDAAVVHLPVTFFLVRIANFINGELCGRVTDVSWAVRMPQCGYLPTHPSQLYEAGGEGLLLWLMVYGVSKYYKTKGVVAVSFVVSYSIIRLWIETYFRAPTYELSQILSSGQILCLLMICIGLLMGMSCWKYQSQCQKA